MDPVTPAITPPRLRTNFRLPDDMSQPHLGRPPTEHLRSVPPPAAADPRFRAASQPIEYENWSPDDSIEPSIGPIEPSIDPPPLRSPNPVFSELNDDGLGAIRGIWNAAQLTFGIALACWLAYMLGQYFGRGPS